jgi:hypothetical protein
MDFRNKIITFMEYISIYLYEKLSISKDLIFNEDDKNSILSWNDRLAEDVFSRIRLYINDEKPINENAFLHGAPFCIKGQPPFSCDDCDFAKHHNGDCESEDSDFAKIINMDNDTGCFLTHDFLKDLIFYIATRVNLKFSEFCRYYLHRKLWNTEKK